MKTNKKTVPQRIEDFLNKNPNQTFTPKEIAKSIGANPNTVRGRLSDIRKGKIKNVKIKKSKKGLYEKFVDIALRKKYRLWKVSFKLIETLKHANRQNAWDNKIMNLEAHVIGLAPKKANSSRVKNIAGSKLFVKVLETMQENGVSLWNSVDDNKSIYIDASIINENPINADNYNSEWNGNLEFVGSTGVTLSLDISIDIELGEW